MVLDFENYRSGRDLNRTIQWSLILLLIFLITPFATNAQITSPTTICPQGYVQGNVPTTQIPDYSYTKDGVLELHFRLDITRWKYNYGKILIYDKDCNLLVGGIGMWGDKRNFAWPAVKHIVLRPEDSPDYPGFYRYKVFNGETGELLLVDLQTPLGNVTRVAFNPVNHPIFRLIFSSRTAVDFDWHTETGDLISTPALPIKIAPRRNPVLIVPGVLGTDINKGSEKLWLDLGRNFTDVGDQFMDPLQLNADLIPLNSELSVGDVINKETVNIGTGGLSIFDYTFSLKQEFQNQGYIEGTDLFTFPYDWRYGVSGVFLNGQTNVDLLQQKIQEIMTKTGKNTVDVVAHSTGGLLVKKYVMDNLGHNVGKAVFVGVPNTGAPKAILGLLVGDDFGIPWLAESEMKKISKNLPVIYDLTPSQQYFNAKGSYVKIVDRGVFGSTSRNLDFNQTSDFLISDRYLNRQALSNAHGLHTLSFDNFDLRTAGVDLYSINGCKAATIGKVIELRDRVLGGTVVSYLQPEFVPGDSTVPLESATNLPIDSTKKYYALKANHGKMLSQDGIRQRIVNLISGSALLISDSLMTQDETKCKLNGKAISVYSPVDISVTDAHGNRASVSEDGVSIKNDIPNVNLEVIGGHKFLYLPDDEGQTYTVVLRGSGEGTFTLKNATINNNQVMHTEIFADVPVTMALSGQVALGAAMTTLALDTNGDGNIDRHIEPTLVEFPDNIPPEVAIQFDPTLKDLRFTGTDNVSTPNNIGIIDTGGKVILTDQAGNTLDVGFIQTNRRSALKADVQSLVYNGQPASIISNLLSFSWRLDTQGVLKSLTQTVKSRGGFSIKAVYDGTKTVLTGTDQTGRISQTVNGLVLLKVTTSQGDLQWKY